MGIIIRKVTKEDQNELLSFVNSFFNPNPTMEDNSRGFITHKYSIEDIMEVIDYPFSLVAIENNRIIGCLFALYKREFLEQVPEYFDDYYPKLHKDLPSALQSTWSPKPTEEIKKKDFIFVQLVCVPKTKAHVAPLLFEYLSYMPSYTNLFAGHVNYCSELDNRVCNEAALKMNIVRFKMTPCLSRFRKETQMYNLFVIGHIKNLRKGILRRYKIEVNEMEECDLAG